MGALLNNSNGCPRMPIRNTTAIKDVSILGAEWRPCSKWRHYSCYPPEDAAPVFILLLLFPLLLLVLVMNLFLYLLILWHRGKMFGFWRWMYVLQGEKLGCWGFGRATVSQLYSCLNSAFFRSLQGETQCCTQEKWVSRKSANCSPVAPPILLPTLTAPTPIKVLIHSPPTLLCCSKLSGLLKDELLIADLSCVVVSNCISVWDLKSFMEVSAPGTFNSNCIKYFKGKKKKKENKPALGH